MILPNATRAAAFGLLLGIASVASAQPSDDCIPNPLQPGACLDLESLIPGLSRADQRPDSRMGKPARARDDTSRSRLRGRQRPSQTGITSNGHATRSRTSPTAPSKQGTVGAAAAGSLGAALGAKVNPTTSTAAQAAPPKPAKVAPPVDQAAQERARARAKARRAPCCN